MSCLQNKRDVSPIVFSSILRPMPRFALITCWIIAVSFGTFLLTAYELAPSQAGKSAVLWPKNQRISLHPNKPTLVMFVHSHCPCTRASLGELSILLTKCRGRVQTHVLLVKPPGKDDDWVQTDIGEQAMRIPGVNVVTDVDGVLADQFNAHTSGKTLLYDMSGQLRFSGGITVSRGHHGESDARRNIVNWILNGNDIKRTAPVFGCPLQNETNN